MSEKPPSLSTPWGALRWIARIWSIGPILFVAAEIVTPHADPGVAIPGSDWLAVGLLGASVFALALAWWQEWLGGWLSVALFVLFLAAYWIFRGEFFPWQGLLWLGNVLGPAILFVFYGWQARKLG